MQTSRYVLLLGLVFGAAMSAWADDSLVAGGSVSSASDASNSPRHGPPPQAYDDCRNRKAGESVQHLTREGTVAATCIDSPEGLVARPNQGAVMAPKPEGSAAQGHPQNASPDYTLDQSISDRAQLRTMAFDALAFLSGNLAADTFLPPGKVSDYFGFQYLRDIDAQHMGHNTAFLTRIAFNMLAILTPEQREQLQALAQQQQSDIQQFALRRFPLMKAFRMNLEGQLPEGSRGLVLGAVRRYSADLYALDGKLAYERAQVMASLYLGFSAEQKAALQRLRFGYSGSWPDVADPMDRPRMSHEIDVAVMTYASEMFSWVAGSIEADTYFCPERHGMYFGGFGLKTAPAMHKPNYSISTSLTGDKGEAFLALLNDQQRQQLLSVLEEQRPLLQEIVGIRHETAIELRRFLGGEPADADRIAQLSRRYGELDGEIAYRYATAFARIGGSLSRDQQEAVQALRGDQAPVSAGPYLYSNPIDMPAIENAEQFFR